MVAHAQCAIQPTNALFPGLSAQCKLHKVAGVYLMAHQMPQLLGCENRTHIDDHAALLIVAAGIKMPIGHRPAVVIISFLPAGAGTGR